jgi:PAS domain S-box-containing protein
MMKLHIQATWQQWSQQLISIPHPGRARQAQLMASLVLGVILICYSTIFAAIPFYWHNPAPWFLVAMLVTSVFWLPYFLFRMGHLQTASVIYALWVTIQILIMAWVLGLPRGLGHLYYIVMGSAFIAFIFPNRLGIVLLAISCTLLGLIAPLILPVSLDEIINGPVTFNIVAGILLLVFGRYWHQQQASNAAGLKENQERYQLISELSSDFTVFCRFLPDSNQVNREWVIGAHEAITGYTVEETRGPEGDTFWHPDDQPRLRADRDRVQLGEQFTAEYRFIRKDGTVRWVSMTRKPVWNDAQTQVIGFYAVLQDVSNRKERDVQQFKAMIQSERLSVLRNFIHAISHDFRNRLSVIETNRYLIGRSLEPATQQKLQPRLDTVANTIIELREQITNLLDICAIEEPVFTRFDVNTVLRQLLEDRQTDVVDKAVNLKIVLDPAIQPILGDQDQITRALDHLLKNAVTYTESGGAVTITSELRDSQLVLSITDTGIGIAPDQIEQIFEPFFKVNEARTVNSGGIGVGLTVVKLVADIHGGQVRVQSESGHGSRFELILPLVQPSLN